MNDDHGSSDNSFLIVTGSSAGGIDALRSLVAGLPGKLQAAVVVAQHLDPTRQSRLDQILGQHSALPLRIVNEREELRPGTVYLVPANHDVAIIDHAANTYLETRGGAKPSIDRLFTSAAERYGDRVIAIILSGLGSDGLAGARSIKEHGGTVIVQEPASASYPALPMLIPPNVLDFVARPEQMGALVGTLLRRTEAPEEPDQQSMLRSLLTEMRDRTGIDFLQYKMPTIMRRLSRLMVATGCETLPEYIRYLQRHPDAYQKLVSAFLIKVTEFFRDAQLFEELRSSILPRLIQEAVQNNGELRIWSAGSSTGEEAYSIAMLCADICPDDMPQVRVFATDIDEDAIAFARRGIYGLEALQDVPPALVQRYFVRVGDSYEVGKRIRNMTVFGQHDLAQRAPFPRIDLVLCRNVLIYFTKELQTRALQLFAFALRDKGYLVLGRAESTTPLATFFQQTNGPLKIFQRVGERILIPPTRFKDLPQTVDPRQTQSSSSLPRQVVLQRQPEFRPTAAETVGKFIFSSLMGVVVVDRRYDIITLNPAARAMLQIHGVGVGDDLIHSAQGIDREAIRSLVDAAFRGETPDGINLEIGNDMNERRTLKVLCLYDPSATNRTEGVALVLLDVTDEARRTTDFTRITTEQAQSVEELTKRVSELGGRQRALLKANDDLTMANSELRTMNEQLLINAEEAASSHEEVETLNEEMQATNEELETLNEELQATVEELNTTNDELQSRSSDLESSNANHEARISSISRERDALSRALELRGEFIGIFDDEFNVLYVTPTLADDPILNEPERLRNKREAKISDGRTAIVSAYQIQLDGKSLQVITLAPRG
jgi:two-component system, chemotaxis family, CheB/CheR fusion protein